jgi:hypothetical protein
MATKMRLNLPDGLVRMVAAGCLACVLPSCMLNGESRIAQGQLYTSGNPSYDAFFRDVHQQQRVEASWDDDKKDAKKPLLTTLDLTAETPDVTIVQMTHESASKGAKQPGSVRLDVDGAAPRVVAAGGGGDASALFHAVEETARQELDRAKRLRAIAPKLDALTKQEADLEGRVKTDFTKYGETKLNEVATELAATRDVVAKMKAHAEAEARESEDFVADLGRGLETAAEEKVPRTEGRRAREPRERKKREESASSGSTKATAQAAESPPPAAKPAPPPAKPAEPGEVFTP